MNIQISENLIKVVLSVLFLLCLIDMPYGFYQLIRFIALIGFGVLAYKSYQKERQTEFVIYGVTTFRWTQKLSLHAVSLENEKE